MLLSMWILADWLKLYEPECAITQGGRILRNARMANDNLWYSPSTVYLELPEPNVVVCRNGNDLITIHCDDVNDLFNDILDAFEFYSDTLESIEHAIRRGCTALELLQNCQVLLPRSMILADATFYIRDIWDPGGLLIKTQLQRDAMERRIMPQEKIREISQYPYIRQKNIPSYEMTVSDLGTIGITNLFSGELHSGWLITVNETNTCSQAVLDLQNVIGELIETWFAQDASVADHNEKSGIFMDLLDGIAPEDQQADERLQGFEWEPQDPKELFVLRQTGMSRMSAQAFQSHLEYLSRNSFIFQYHGNTIFIINRKLTDLDEFQEQFRQSMSANGFIAGAGPVFTDLAGIHTCYQAAITAADYADYTPGTIAYFHEKVIPYACTLLRRGSTLDLRHPAIELLRAYDTRHHTELLQTLRIYMETSLNLAETSRQLFIHRSTLLYRLERIVDLTGADLTLPEERFHLELSFYLDDAAGQDYAD